MANKNNYNEATIIRKLSKNSEIKIESVGKTIEILKDNSSIGIHSWGKIDYLKKVCGYVIIFVNNITKRKPIKNVIDESNFINSKTIKRDNKLNMAAMSKSAMKKAKSK